MALVVAVPGLASGQDYFSCSFFERPACLDRGDKVCSSYAKCVDETAVCFNSYTCDFNGFVCKSTLDDLTDDYDELATTARAVASDYDSLRTCVEYAATIREAQDCL